MDFKSENGSVIVFIFIAIALFGALGYAVSTMMRGGNETIRTEQAALYASGMLDSARALHDVVRQLKILNDCSDTEVSFENNFVPDYTHSPQSRADCRVFHPDGGGLSYIRPNLDWLDPLKSSETGYGLYYFSGKPRADGVGSSLTDIILFLNYIATDVCLQVNDIAGIDNPSSLPPLDVGAIDTFHTFDGSFDTGSALNPPEAHGHLFGCFQDSGQNRNIFYQVILAR